jgi:hypothetical protein
MKAIQPFHEETKARRTRSRFLGILCAFVSFVGLVFQVSAQPSPCGIVDALDFPLDPALFTIAQDYGAPSPRHQGRYHTGEDWTLRDDPARAQGQFVRAIADGRVLFASPNGWGRDGGVIMLEHAFPDGTTATSLYGHLTDSTGIPFPALYACIERGAILAAIADVRPAPHLHLEIRTESASTPGAGYMWDNPTTLGHRRPSKFITNWRLWLSDAYRWHLDLGDETGAASPPIQLSDDSLIYADRERLARVNANGGVLWRVNLDASPVAWRADDRDGVWVALTNGDLLHYGADGVQIGAQTLAAPIAAGVVLETGWVLQTPDGTLLDAPDEGTPIRLAALDPIRAARISGDLLIVHTRTDQIVTVRRTDGAILDSAQLRGGAALGVDADGAPLVYSRGGLWRIERRDSEIASDLADQIVWTPAPPFAPAGGARAAVYADADGYTLYDGVNLLRYGRDGGAQWGTPFAGDGAAARLVRRDSYYLLTTDAGTVAAFRVTDGARCGSARAYGDGRSRAWAAWGLDGLLRIHVADQIVALDWRRVVGGCT